jgi:phage tail-like protein
MAQPGKQPVYYRAFQFMVEIDGIDQARFQEASGIEASVELIEFREGGDALRMRKLPGHTKHSNLTLKRGYTDDDRLWQWFQQVMDGQTEGYRRSISLVQHDMAGKAVHRWNLHDAFPVKYTTPSFNAAGKDLAIEVLEIAYEYIKRV